MAFSTNGVKVIQINTFTLDTKDLDQFPSPQEVWEALGRNWDKNDPRLGLPLPTLAEVPDDQKPTLYQAIAIGRVLDALVDGKRRIAVSMIAGSGKTYITINLVWKIINSKYLERVLWIGEGKAYINFIQEKLAAKSVVLTEASVGDSSAPVHLVNISFFLDQQNNRYFQRLPADYYDLIIIDGATATDEMLVELAHFSGTVQFMVADPSQLRADQARNYFAEHVRNYFGEPVFTYSLQDAIEAEQVEPPVGYYAVRLEDISRLQTGLSDIRHRVTASIDPSQSYPIVTGKDIQDDGSIDFDDLERIDLEAERFRPRLRAIFAKAPRYFNLLLHCRWNSR